jgi:hypothetical protein
MQACLASAPAVATPMAGSLRRDGYCVARPNLGNYDGECPSILFKGERSDFRPVTDAFAPDQQQRLEAFVRGQAGIAPPLGR